LSVKSVPESASPDADDDVLSVRWIVEPRLEP
jgi:hypothetical protein